MLTELERILTDQQQCSSAAFKQIFALKASLTESRDPWELTSRVGGDI